MMKFDFFPENKLSYTQSKERFLQQVKPLCKIIRLLISDNDSHTAEGTIFYRFNSCDVICYENFNYLEHLKTINDYYLDNQYVLQLNNMVVFYYDTFYRVEHSYYHDARKYLKKFISSSYIPDIFYNNRYYSWNNGYAFRQIIHDEFPSLIQPYKDVVTKMELLQGTKRDRRKSSQKSKEIVQSLHDKFLQLIKRRNHVFFIKPFIISLAIRNENNSISRFANNKLFDGNVMGEICQFFFATKN